MALIITGATIGIFTGAFGDLFDQQSNGRYIIVNKEPLKTLTTNPQSYPGYNEPNQLEYTYSPQSGIYRAVILYEYKTEAYDAQSLDTKTRLAGNNLVVKVEEPCRNYILNGKTQSVVADGLIYNEVTPYKVQHYLGLQYYYFNLKGTY